MRIKSIKKVEPRKVYAIQTSTGTFIADGLAHHNCVACNMFKKGEIDVYTIKLLDLYGQGILEELQRRKNQSKKFTVLELQEMMLDWKIKIKEME